METLVRATVKEAREMGVLIADPETPATTSEGEQPTKPQDPQPSPKLVPITHRR